MTKLKELTLHIFGCRVKMTPDINPKYGQMDRPCPDNSKTECRWYVIGDKFINPINGFRVKLPPFINLLCG